MTVRQLIDFLETQPPEARVFEDNKGELRELRPADINSDACADGNPIDWNEYDDEEASELRLSAIVILGAWS